MCKYAVKKLPFLIKLFLDEYKTQQMCDNAVAEKLLKFVPCNYENRNMCNQAVNNYVDPFKLSELFIFIFL